MPYDFDESRTKLKEEVVEEIHQQSIEKELMIDEKVRTIGFGCQFFMSIVMILFFFYLTLLIWDLENIYVRIGLGLYLSYPSLCIIAEILFTKKVRYRYYEGSFSIGKYRFRPEDVKKVAITEYSPYYLKNSYFKIPAVNFVGYKEFLIQLTPHKEKGDAVDFFLCSEDTAQTFMDFLYKHKIPYGHVEKDYRKLFFYY